MVYLIACCRFWAWFSGVVSLIGLGCIGVAMICDLGCIWFVFGLGVKPSELFDFRVCVIVFRVVGVWLLRCCLGG